MNRMNNIIIFKNAIYYKYYLYNTNNSIESIHISIFTYKNGRTKVIMQSPIYEVLPKYEVYVFEEVLQPLFSKVGVDVYNDVDVYIFRENNYYNFFQDDESFINRMERVVIDRKNNVANFTTVLDEDLASNDPSIILEGIAGDEIIWLLQKYKVMDQEKELIVYRRN